MTVDVLARNAILTGGAGCQNLVPMLPAGGISFLRDVLIEEPVWPARPHSMIVMGDTQPSFRVFVSDKKQNVRETTNWIWRVDDSATIDLPSRKSRIEKLAEDWLRDTQWDSSFYQIMQHPSFLKLRNLGAPALAFAISKLRRGNLQMHWFIIAKSIAGEDPTPPHARGYLKEMAQCWVDWYDQRAING